jgi:hypothetical protein
MLIIKHQNLLSQMARVHFPYSLCDHTLHAIVVRHLVDPAIHDSRMLALMC